MAKEKRRLSGSDTHIMMPDGKSQHPKPVRWGLIIAVILAVVAVAAGILYVWSDRAFASLRGLFVGGSQP